MEEDRSLRKQPQKCGKPSMQLYQLLWNKQILTMLSYKPPHAHYHQRKLSAVQQIYIVWKGQSKNKVMHLSKGSNGCDLCIKNFLTTFSTSETSVYLLLYHLALLLYLTGITTQGWWIHCSCKSMGNTEWVHIQENTGFTHIRQTQLLFV